MELLCWGINVPSGRTFPRLHVKLKYKMQRKSTTRMIQGKEQAEHYEAITNNNKNYSHTAA